MNAFARRLVLTQRQKPTQSEMGYFLWQVEREAKNLVKLKRSIACGGMERRAFEEHNEEQEK